MSRLLLHIPAKILLWVLTSPVLTELGVRTCSSPTARERFQSLVLHHGLDQDHLTVSAGREKHSLPDSPLSFLVLNSLMMSMLKDAEDKGRRGFAYSACRGEESFKQRRMETSKEINNSVPAKPWGKNKTT